MQYEPIDNHADILADEVEVQLIGSHGHVKLYLTSEYNHDVQLALSPLAAYALLDWLYRHETILRQEAKSEGSTP